MREDVECPYCKHPQEICHDDGYGYDEDRKHEQQCPKCEKTFVFTTCIILSHEAFKADCLNGEPHKYKLTKTWPKEYSEMECEDCQHRRQLTEEERIANKIRTKAEYIKELDESVEKLRNERSERT